MDIFLLKAFIDELARCLPGSRVSKVFQLSPDDLLLRLWRHRDQRLLLSIHPTWQRLHLSTERFEAPPRPPRFAALLRARLRRARLHAVTVQPYERVVTFAWQQAGEAAPSLRLIHELQGAQANVLLVDAAGRDRRRAQARAGADAAGPRRAAGHPVCAACRAAAAGVAARPDG